MKKHNSSHHQRNGGNSSSKHSPHTSANANGYHSSGSLSSLGDNQGDMKPHVSDIQRPSSSFPEHDFMATTNYVERQNRTQERMSKDIKGQAYQGRYS